MPAKGIAAIVVAAVALMLFFGTYYTVSPYERAVLTRFGQFVSVEGEGLHFKLPLVNSVTFFRTDIQELTPKKPANTYTVDNQEVDIIWKVLYRLEPSSIEYVYRNSQGFQSLLEAIVVDRLKAEMGKINTQHVAEKRGTIRDTIRGTITNDVKTQLGVTITDFQLANIDYTQSFRTAVEAASSAKANIETREQERLQAEKTAETVRLQARGKADAYFYEQEAIAKGVELNGKAEAAAIDAKQKALAQNIAVVELEKARRWDGKLPSQMLSNVVPFMSVDAKAGSPTTR